MGLFFDGGFVSSFVPFFCLWALLEGPLHEFEVTPGLWDADFCQDFYMQQRIREMKKTRPRLVLGLTVDPSHQGAGFQTTFDVFAHANCLLIRVLHLAIIFPIFPSTFCIFMSWKFLFSLASHVHISVQKNPGDIPTARQRPSGSGSGTNHWARTWCFFLIFYDGILEKESKNYILIHGIPPQRPTALLWLNLGSMYVREGVPYLYISIINWIEEENII